MNEMAVGTGEIAGGVASASKAPAKKAPEPVEATAEEEAELEAMMAL